jgi:adenine-specific DNA-methyltransferase
MQNLLQDLKKILSQDQNYILEGKLFKNKIIEDVLKTEPALIKLLLKNKTIKNHFFTEIADVLVFDKVKFQDFVSNEEFLPSSYTKFKNHIGLAVGNKLFSANKEVSIVWPYKDCVLEGGQSREDEDRDEIFYNETLSPDEINLLLEPKVLTNFELWNETAAQSDRPQELKGFNRNEKGVITDNLLIKGNNLLALHTLKKEFEGRVKLIYIDPPYNTGNDSFKYNDNFNHSSWLTFIKNRLEVAKKLLRKDALIFVQCDDKEQAYLKVLMDEIFGRENFINIIAVQMKNIAGASGGGEDKKLKKNIEFLLAYSNDYTSFDSFNNVYRYTELFSLVDSYRGNNISWKYTSVLSDAGKKEYVASAKDGDGNEIKIFKRISPTILPINQLAQKEGITEREVYYRHIDKIFTTAMPQSSIRVRVMEAIREEISKDALFSVEYTPRSGKNKGRVYEQFYRGSNLRLFTWLKDVVEQKDGLLFKKDLQGTLWDNFELNNLTKEGDVLFANGKKPEALLERIIDMSTEERDIVVDFFAGSATTAAVAHKKNRQWITVEQMDYTRDLSRKRLKNVIAAEQGGISKSIKWQGGGSFIYYELMEWNEKLIEKIKEAKNTKELLEIYSNFKNYSFLRYELEDMENFNKADFEKLSTKEQKRILCDCLDKNHLYVNLSEIGDKKFNVSKEDKALNNDFFK